MIYKNRTEKRSKFKQRISQHLKRTAEFSSERIFANSGKLKRLIIYFSQNY